MENLLVRVSRRRNEQLLLEGYVIAFDDVTDLVSAQRSAAWGDIARRIAHEIKNPLTPIQLSAERIRRKFSPKLANDSDELERMTNVIVRQTGDLRLIIDEFSKFARLPQPKKTDEDLVTVINSVVLLQESGHPDIRFTTNLPDTPIVLQIDRTLISQALINLIKNSGEAIETRIKKMSSSIIGEIRVKLKQGQNNVFIAIEDNGVGLPRDRARLFEPYVTTRDKGTGLGLAIVKKIIEEHGGNLLMEDAPEFEDATFCGARVVVELPKIQNEKKYMTEGIKSDE